ncbi:unnamed protein product [Nezara viridula]|uniref:Uncharacterized protein n=1 Tax=Nezara viridula TaxID=85310 RepID=A0A9P0HRQ6_NEZVI|nr:unnamed protein product [Nezara viridula]
MLESSCAEGEDVLDQDGIAKENNRSSTPHSAVLVEDVGRYRPFGPNILVWRYSVGLVLVRLGWCTPDPAVPGRSDLGNALYSPPPAERAAAPSPGFHRQHLVLFKNVTFFHSLL